MARTQKGLDDDAALNTPAASSSQQPKAKAKAKAKAKPKAKRRYKVKQPERASEAKANAKPEFFSISAVRKIVKACGPKPALRKDALVALCKVLQALLTRVIGNACGMMQWVAQRLTLVVEDVIAAEWAQLLSRLPIDEGREWLQKQDSEIVAEAKEKPSVREALNGLSERWLCRVSIPASGAKMVRRGRGGDVVGYCRRAILRWTRLILNRASILADHEHKMSRKRVPQAAAADAEHKMSRKHVLQAAAEKPPDGVGVDQRVPDVPDSKKRRRRFKLEVGGRWTKRRRFKLVPAVKEEPVREESAKKESVKEE